MMFSNYDVKNTYLLACSGGPDSMALFDMLLKHNYNIIVAHVNYKTRDESDSEEQLVKDFCKTNNVTLEVKYFDHNYSGSFEDAARKFRYAFFAEVYKKYNCAGLFVAHHKDDLIETYLMKKQRNVINESYLIKTETIINSMKVIRPLLYSFDKNEILEYCKNNNIPYGIDKTNFMDITIRNVIRRELLSQDKNKIFNEAISEEKQLIEKRKQVKEFIKFYPIYLVDMLKEKDDMFLQIFLHEICDKKYKKHVNKSLLKVARDIMDSEKSNITYHIADSYYLVKEYGKLSFVNIFQENYSYVLSNLNYISTPYFKVVDKGLKMHGIYVSEEEFPITIRNYKTDDKIRLKDGNKKVSRLFIDKKVPTYLRNNTPVIENKNGEVIFVYGLYRKYGLKHVKNNLFIEK